METLTDPVSLQLRASEIANADIDLEAGSGTATVKAADAASKPTAVTVTVEVTFSSRTMTKILAGLSLAAASLLMMYGVFKIRRQLKLRTVRVRTVTCREESEPRAPAGECFIELDKLQAFQARSRSAFDPLLDCHLLPCGFLRRLTGFKRTFADIVRHNEGDEAFVLDAVAGIEKEAENLAEDFAVSREKEDATIESDALMEAIKTKVGAYIEGEAKEDTLKIQLKTAAKTLGMICMVLYGLTHLLHLVFLSGCWWLAQIGVRVALGLIYFRKWLLNTPKEHNMGGKGARLSDASLEAGLKEGCGSAIGALDGLPIPTLPGPLGAPRLYRWVQSVVENLSENSIEKDVERAIRVGEPAGTEQYAFWIEPEGDAEDAPRSHAGENFSIEYGQSQGGFTRVTLTGSGLQGKLQEAVKEAKNLLFNPGEDKRRGRRGNYKRTPKKYEKVSVQEYGFSLGFNVKTGQVDFCVGGKRSRMYRLDKISGEGAEETKLTPLQCPVNDLRTILSNHLILEPDDYQRKKGEIEQKIAGLKSHLDAQNVAWWESAARSLVTIGRESYGKTEAKKQKAAAKIKQLQQEQALLGYEALVLKIWESLGVKGVEERRKAISLDAMASPADSRSTTEAGSEPVSESEPCSEGRITPISEPEINGSLSGFADSD